MDPLTEILNIICKRDSDIRQSVPRGTDHEQVMADAIQSVLDRVYHDGKQAGIEQENNFWLNKR